MSDEPQKLRAAIEDLARAFNGFAVNAPLTPFGQGSSVAYLAAAEHLSDLLAEHEVGA